MLSWNERRIDLKQPFPCIQTEIRELLALVQGTSRRRLIQIDDLAKILEQAYQGEPLALRVYGGKAEGSYKFSAHITTGTIYAADGMLYIALARIPHRRSGTESGFYIEAAPGVTRLGARDGFYTDPLILARYRLFGDDWKARQDWLNSLP